MAHRPPSAALPRRAFLAGAGAALALGAAPPPARAQIFFDPTLRVLPGILVRQGRGYRPLLESVGEVRPVTSRTGDLAMPDTSIPLFEFPENLAVFRDYDLDHSRFISKQEAMLAWLTLMAGIRTGQRLGPGDLRQRVAPDGPDVPLHYVELPRTDRRQIWLLLKETPEGARLIRDMETFLSMQIALGRGPVWLNGYRQGGMESGNRRGH